MVSIYNNLLITVVGSAGGEESSDTTAICRLCGDCRVVIIEGDSRQVWIR